MKSRTLDPHDVFQQWRRFFQQRQQAGRLQRELEALQWIEEELSQYKGQDYPSFRQQCEYILRFKPHSFRKKVEDVFQLLHEKLEKWAEEQFEKTYRYEIRPPVSSSSPFWTIWDRQIGGVAIVRDHVLDDLQTFKQARRWLAGLNDLCFCQGMCKGWTPHELLPEDEVQCQVCLAQRPLMDIDLDK